MSQKTYKIGEIAEITGLKPFVLRFWETEFTQLVPVRTPTGQRLYTDEHLALLTTIKTLLYDEKLPSDGARRRLAGPDREAAVLRQVYDELQDIRRLLGDGGRPRPGTA